MTLQMPAIPTGASEHQLKANDDLTGQQQAEESSNQSLSTQMVPELHTASDADGRGVECAYDRSVLPELSEKVVRLRDHSTRVIDSYGGGGIPIVLIHALSMECHMWKDVFPRLATSTTINGARRRVIAYDLRGHGQARAAPLTQSFDHLVEDLLELLETLGLDEIDVYGVSYGGAVAQSFVLAHPERVRSVAIIASTSTGSHIMASRATKAEAEGVESLLPETIARWFLPETIAATETSTSWMVRYAEAGLRTARVEDWSAAWRTMASLNCLDRLGDIKVPVLVLASTQDTSTPPKTMKRTCEGCKFGEYRELDHGMHLFVMENAEVASAELLAFRGRVDRM
jgi:3-oxoadipate enol-lactonase